MKYTVVSAPVADQQLADIWLKATDRQGVANAFNRIESSLKYDAHLEGREHPNGCFRVSKDDRLVTILSVAYRA